MDIYEYLRSKLDDEIESKVTWLSNGTALDFAEYKHICGQIFGLRASLQVVNTAERAEKEALGEEQ